jgi:hypothetical protein
MQKQSNSQLVDNWTIASLNGLASLVLATRS